MAKIEINVLSRPYKIICSDGDEAEVVKFAKDLDQQMRDLQVKMPNVSDINLFVIHSIITMAKLSDTQNQLTLPSQAKIDDEVISEFEKVALKLETLAKNIKNI